MIYLTLLPYPSFRQSVSCYSDVVLKKTLQVMCYNRKAIAGTGRCDYRNREMWQFWRPWYQAYIRLGLMCMEEMDLRNLPYPREKTKHFSKEKSGKHWDKPLWVGWNRLHSNHRAILLQIGEVECIQRRIVKLLRLENVSVEERADSVEGWLMDNGFNNLWEGSARDDVEVHAYLDNVGGDSSVDPPFNHYKQFGWTEEAFGCFQAFPPDPDSSWMAITRSN